MFDFGKTDFSKEKLEEVEKKAGFELVEMLPVLGLIASAVLIALLVYMPHPHLLG